MDGKVALEEHFSTELNNEYWDAKGEEDRNGKTHITSRDWGSYHILRTTEVPPIEVELLDRPDEPPLGAGEGTVAPASAALVNAVADAAGHRMRELPLSPHRVKAVLADAKSRCFPRCRSRPQ